MLENKLFMASVCLTYFVMFGLIVFQGNKLNDLKEENARLSQELALSKQLREADKEAYSAQIRLIREVNERVENQRSTLWEYRDLPDDAWVRAVIGGLFLQNGDGNKDSNASGSAVRSMQGTDSAGAASNGKDNQGVR